MSVCMFFFFNDTATTEIYTLSLHDALPILRRQEGHQRLLMNELNHCVKNTLAVVQSIAAQTLRGASDPRSAGAALQADRKSTRLNSSHANISYAVFCLKKKKQLVLIYITTS